MLIAPEYEATLRNLADSFEPRIVFDLLSADRKENGLFYTAVSGNQLGTFDVLYDPTTHDQISVGRLAYRNDRTYFDTWTSFPARSARNRLPVPPVKSSLDNFQIDANIENDLSMKVTTRATLTLNQDVGPALPFSISRNMHITAASIDGQPVEVFERESVRANLIFPSDDRQILLVSPSALQPNKPHEIEIHHEGSVIEKAGDSVTTLVAGHLVSANRRRTR